MLFFTFEGSFNIKCYLTGRPILEDPAGATQYIQFQRGMAVIAHLLLTVCHYRHNYWLKPLSANPTKWSNTLKQFIGKLLTNCLSVSDHFPGLTLKWLKGFIDAHKFVNTRLLFYFTIRTQTLFLALAKQTAAGMQLKWKQNAQRTSVVNNWDTGKIEIVLWK